MYCKHLLLLLSCLMGMSLVACTHKHSSESTQGPATTLPPRKELPKPIPRTSNNKDVGVAVVKKADNSPNVETTSAVLPEDPKPAPSGKRPIQSSDSTVDAKADAEAAKNYLIQGNKGGEKDRILKSYFQYAEGRRALKSRKYDEAIQLFNKTIELNPNYADGYYYRGLAYLLTNQTRLAERDYGVAVRLSPKLATRSKFGDVIFEQAKVKIESGAKATDIVSLAKFSKRFKTKQKLSDLSELLFQRAVKKAKSSDDRNAMADFKIGLDIDPNLVNRRELASVFDRRGFDLMKEDRFAVAKVCFENALTVNPNYKPAKIHIREVQSYLSQDVQGLPTNLKERIAYLKAKPLTDRNYLRYMPILVQAYNEVSKSKVRFLAEYPLKAKKGKSKGGQGSNKLVVNDKLLSIPLFQSISEPIDPTKATAFESEFRSLADRFYKSSYRAAELNFARNEIFMAWEHVKGASNLCDKAQSKDTMSLKNQIIDRMMKLVKPEILNRYYSRYPTLKAAIERRKKEIKRKNTPKPKEAVAPPPAQNEYQLFIIIAAVIVLLLLVYIIANARKGKNVKQFTKKMEGNSEKVDHLGAYEEWKTKGSQYNKPESEDA